MSQPLIVAAPNYADYATAQAEQALHASTSTSVPTWPQAFEHIADKAIGPVCWTIIAVVTIRAVANFFATIIIANNQ